MTDDEVVATVATIREMLARVDAIIGRMEAERRDLRHELVPLKQQLLAMVERQLEDPELNERQRQQFEEMKRDFLQPN